ncbi:hypothetical protein BDP55DRAFT_431956 [Colletotrichum godetiae]|uniref:Uncharacterized protein n=1 Tax=Colletotrichum godetiae TaxID=1209918 RepID=A0AAJ0F152_9PEZI|nr:uncharacterized protein BDP55DRAFT_431956 [Colletotrichum godetiae]KAK1689188.1 hypothetical protein BDP55DRAFT_431956 [Colletotrichum godetiae]
MHKKKASFRLRDPAYLRPPPLPPPEATLPSVPERRDLELKRVGSLYLPSYLTTYLHRTAPHRTVHPARHHRTVPLEHLEKKKKTQRSACFPTIETRLHRNAPSHALHQVLIVSSAILLQLDSTPLLSLTSLLSSLSLGQLRASASRPLPLPPQQFIACFTLPLSFCLVLCTSTSTAPTHTPHTHLTFVADTRGHRHPGFGGSDLIFTFFFSPAVLRSACLKKASHSCLPELLDLLPGKRRVSRLHRHNPLQAPIPQPPPLHHRAPALRTLPPQPRGNERLQHKLPALLLEHSRLHQLPPGDQSVKR